MAYRHTEKTLARKAEIRRRVITEALELVSGGGFSALTIVAVAAQSKIATGAVYKHFDSKAALFAEVFRIATEQELAMFREHALAPGSPSQRLLHVIEAFALRALHNPQLAYALIAEPVDSLIDIQRLHYRQAYADMFVQLVEHGMACGEFAPQTASVSAAALVGVIAESLIGPLSWSASEGPHLDDSALIAAIQAFCLRAVAAKPAAGA